MACFNIMSLFFLHIDVSNRYVVIVKISLLSSLLSAYALSLSSSTIFLITLLIIFSAFHIIFIIRFSERVTLRKHLSVECVVIAMIKMVAVLIKSKMRRCNYDKIGYISS